MIDRLGWPRILLGDRITDQAGQDDDIADARQGGIQDTRVAEIARLKFIVRVIEPRPHAGLVAVDQEVEASHGVAKREKMRGRDRADIAGPADD
jgi:hypothetical protein